MSSTESTTGASVAETMQARLPAAFDVREIEVVDESEAHRGHAGYQEGGESHFRIRMRSGDLAGMSRIACHRNVHAALGEDIMSRIHALSLDLGT